MTWYEFVQNMGGWGAAIYLVAEFLRRLLKGDIVLRSQYDLIVKTADEATKESKELLNKSGEQSAKTIESQADLIKMMREERQR